MSDAKTWEARVVEWRASGLPATKFCEGKDFSYPSLHSWASRLKKKATQTIPLAKVVRPLVAAAPPGRRQLEVHTARVLIPAELDTAAVVEILKALLSGGGETR